MGKRQRERKERRNLKMSKRGPKVPNVGTIRQVLIPDDEKTVLKEVPAKAGDQVVGTAVIYDDGSVDVIFDKEANPEAVELIKKLEGDLGGYSIGTEQ